MGPTKGARKHQEFDGLSDYSGARKWAWCLGGRPSSVAETSGQRNDRRSSEIRRSRTTALPGLGSHDERATMHGRRKIPRPEKPFAVPRHGAQECAPSDAAGRTSVDAISRIVNDRAPCNTAVEDDRPPRSRVARREGDHSWSPEDSE